MEAFLAGRFRFSASGAPVQLCDSGSRCFAQKYLSHRLHRYGRGTNSPHSAHFAKMHQLAADPDVSLVVKFANKKFDAGKAISSTHIADC
jgi:hypothetical protein